MNTDKAQEHLSRISTMWSQVNQAHGGGPETAPEAQRRLMQRYCGAVYHYLLGAVRDEEVATDLFQEFALRFVRGDFHRADPGRGRFRDYVRKSLIHLVADYRRARQRQPEPLPGDVADPSSIACEDESEFLKSWREELISRAWQALAQANATLHAVLLCHVENPGASAAQIAESLQGQQGRLISPGNVRVLLHRARKQFADLLKTEVVYSLESAGDEHLAKEMQDLGLEKLLIAT